MGFIVGILLEETKPPSHGDSYVEQAYVDYIQGAGALTVPIR